MIEPIYFPFTYVPQWVAQTLAAGFKHFYVYQPSGKELPAAMQTWVGKHVMNLCVPVPAEDENFTEVVREFQRFARLHADNKNLRTAAFWNRQGAVPFFNETSASQIVADLRKDKTEDAGLSDPETLLRARVFLEFAQEFDRQHTELQQELGETDRRSEDLLMNLSGQKDGASPVTRLTAEIKFDDPAEYMVQDRLQAWIRLFMEEPIDSGLVLTSSPLIFNYLVDHLPTAEKILESKTLPAKPAYDDAVIARRETLLNQIKNLIESDRPTAEEACAHLPAVENHSERFMLTLYRLPGCNPAQLFARFLKAPYRTQSKSVQLSEIHNTLFGLIQRNPSER